jgi:hydroxymethylglutaryl-CoA reductase
MTSRLPGFHKLSATERRALVARQGGLGEAEAGWFEQPLPDDIRDRLSENVVGSFELPLAIATNFIVNGREVLVPMAVEESSVVAAASHAAKLARSRGGFVAHAGPPIMAAQVQLVDVPDLAIARRNVQASGAAIARAAGAAAAGLAARGGGYRGMKVRAVDTEAGKCLVVHLLVDVRDAMGANVVNRVAEAVAPLLADLAGGRPLLRILTNLADERVVTARATFPRHELGGADVARDVVKAWALADADPYRAATHNKGVMNGVDAVVLATGNDWRAAEAGAHAWAARTGRYRSLTRYRLDEAGDLVGEIDLPLALGLVGGVTNVHPAARASLKLLGAKTSGELAEIVASVGLAQNLAALRALATEGIQRGHMRLHAHNLALAAGVPAERVDEVVAAMLSSGEEPSAAAARAAWERLSGRPARG